MAWELQGHMHEYIAPSIAAYCRNTEYTLATLYADIFGTDGLAGAARRTPEEIMDALVAEVIAYAATTNGGHEFYIDGWTSIPWCSDEVRDLWYY